MKHSQILQWKQPHLVELVRGQQNHLWIQRGRVQQDHFGSPMAAGARGAAREGRERKREERNREMGGVEEEDQARPATMTSRAFKRE